MGKSKRFGDMHDKSGKGLPKKRNNKKQAWDSADDVNVEFSQEDVMSFVEWQRSKNKKS